MSQGRFIAFCDSDDRWYGEKLEKQLAFMIKKQCALSYTSYMVCDENDLTTGIVVCNHKIHYKSLKWDDGIGCLTAIYDSFEFGKIYLPDIRKRQDWGLWLKIMKKCKIAYGMKEPLAIYRIHSNSISHNKFALVKYNIAIYKQILKYSYCIPIRLFTKLFFKKDSSIYYKLITSIKL